MTTLVASIVIFGLLVFFHEFGHFMVAKRLGIGVLEFAIGFGPKLVSVERGGTSYSIRALPLGGMCRLLGEDPEDGKGEGNFQNSPLSHRLAVVAAGPLMNFVLAFLLFFLIYFFIFGVPQVGSTGLGEVFPGDRADKAGLKAGDVILSVNGQEKGSWDSLVQAINSNPENELALLVERDGRREEISVTPRLDPRTEKGMIGIAPQSQKYSLISSINLGLSNTWWFTRFIVVNIAQIITRQVPADVAGPIGIVQMVGEVAHTGLSNLMTLTAILSLHLGLLNLLPIPALDGSRIMFFFIEALRGKPVDPMKESMIHFIGFTFLILLTIFIAFKDLARLEIF